MILVVLGIFPFYFILLLSGERGVKVKEITEKVYQELQETDPMYGYLSYGAQVSQVYVEQQLGDAYVYVYVTAPEKSADEFENWLVDHGEDGRFSREKNIFQFSYFVSDSHAQFGEYEESKGLGILEKIYWIAGTVLIILLFIPFEEFPSKRSFHKDMDNP